MKQKLLLFCSEYFIFVGAFLMMWLVIGQDTVMESWVMLGTVAVTIISLWFIGALLKYTIRKERPSKELRKNIERDRYAFPSMHALTLASSACYIGMHNLYLGVIACAIAFIVMYARVKTHMHYAVDMIAGFCFGAIYTYTLSPYIEQYVSAFLSKYI
jgi:membrane-associated phospholipid phosphatase